MKYDHSLSTKLYYRVEQLLPENIACRIQCVRRKSHWQKDGIIFIHVPKAAGTSISTLLYGRPLGHLPASVIQRVYPELYATSDVFSIVRNPWSRLVSAYNFAKKGSSGIMGVEPAFQKEISSYDDFGCFIQNWLMPENLINSNPVFRPQFYYLQAHGDIIVDNVMKYEQLDKVELFLRSKKTNINEIPKLNVSSSVDYVAAYQGSNELIELVREKYWEDVDQFGYEFGD